MACPCDLAGVTAALPAAMPALDLVFFLTVLYYAIKHPLTSMLILGNAIILKAVDNPIATNGWLSAWMLAAGIFCIWDIVSRIASFAKNLHQKRRAKKLEVETKINAEQSTGR